MPQSRLFYRQPKKIDDLQHRVYPVARNASLCFHQNSIDWRTRSMAAQNKRLLAQGSAFWMNVAGDALEWLASIPSRRMCPQSPFPICVGHDTFALLLAASPLSDVHVSTKLKWRHVPRVSTRMHNMQVMEKRWVQHLGSDVGTGLHRSGTKIKVQQEQRGNVSGGGRKEHGGDMSK